jgi:membrane protease YdiL (CAAX protease family)
MDCFIVVKGKIPLARLKVMAWARVFIALGGQGAVGYSIVMTSLTGLFLGVLWMRTKNFVVLVIVHAAGDLLPNLAPWMRAFHGIR